MFHIFVAKFLSNRALIETPNIRVYISALSSVVK